jgi:hypothetical protein
MATVNPYEIEEAQIGFSNTLQLFLQQQDSRLSASCNKGMHIGKTASPINYLAPTQFRQAGPRGSHLTGEFSQYQRRWVSPQDKDNTIWVDSFDLLRAAIDPKSMIAANIAAAANRIKDDVIIAAFFAVAKIGGDPSTQTDETFDTGADFPISVSIADTFGVGTEVGVTVDKMNEAKRILMKYENSDAATLHMGMTSQGLKDLMGEVLFTSTDFRAQATYDAMGRPTAFNGFNFHYSERFAYNPADSDERWLPVWVQDGMHLGLWSDVQTIISQRNDVVSHPWQAYSMLTIGASRMQPGQVIKMAVKDGSGGSITP